MARQIISDRFARVLIAVGSSFSVANQLIPRDGETFKFPDFNTGFFPVYIPMTTAILALFRVPGLSDKMQNAILIILVLTTVGNTALTLLQSRTVPGAQQLVGTVVPSIGAAALVA